MKSLILISIVLALDGVYSQGIKTISPCKGELDDGRLVDLSTLDNARNPPL